MVTVQIAGPSDAATMARLNGWVHALHTEAEPDAYRDLDPAWLAEQLARSLEEGRERAWLASNDGEAIGMLRCEHKTRQATPYAHARAYVEVHELVVTPSARRRGVGALLMQHAETWAGELGVEVQLSCRAFNHDARHFYEASGYEVVQVRFRKRPPPHLD